LDAEFDREKAGQIQRVLIYRLGSLGDTIVSLPALRLAARAFPNAKRVLLTNIPISAKAPAAAAVLENTGLVVDYMRYSVGTRSPLELLALWGRIVRFRPQVLVYLAAGRGVKVAQRDVTFFRLCGISTFYGVPDTEDLQANRWQPEASALEPEADLLCRRLAALGDAHPEDPANWRLCLTSEELEQGRAVLGASAGRPVIAASLGTKLQVNEWGNENWRALAASLAARYPGYTLLLTGAEAEWAASEYVAEGWRGQPGAGPVINACGRLSLRQTAAAFVQADVFIGHDSGPVHLAAALQVPCVGIFAARHLPRIWFPYGKGHTVLYHQVDCSGCRLETCIVEKKKCIASIAPDEVLAAAVKVLEQLARSRNSVRNAAGIQSGEL
jgi:ADP-heptose:LPS heptosyltransferase